MPRVNRLITIEFKINEKLKEEENASGLINRLLDDHYNKHLSNNLKFLNEEFIKIEDSIKSLEIQRDRFKQRINNLTEQEEKNAEYLRKEKERKILENKKQEKINSLSKWLGDKVRNKEITFDDFRAIKELENWPDIVEQLINGKLNLKDILVRITNKPKSI